MGAAGLGGPTTGGLNNGEGKNKDGQSGKTPEFIPGQDGNLYWNTSVPMNQRPTLLYLYNGHDLENDDCERSRSIEKDCFCDKKVIDLARQFACEKICFGCSEFSRRPKHRKPLHDYLDGMAKAGELGARLVILDPSGRVLHEYKDKAPTPKALAATLRSVVKDYVSE